MSQLVAMFCDIDDFCKRFEPIYTQRLLHSGSRTCGLRTIRGSVAKLLFRELRSL
jgi:hypothetical protein